MQEMVSFLFLEYMNSNLYDQNIILFLQDPDTICSLIKICQSASPSLMKSEPKVEKVQVQFTCTCTCTCAVNPSKMGVT